MQLKINPEQINPQMLVLARESRGLTQSELAKMLSIGQAKMSKIENGFISLSARELMKLSDLLNYPDHFFTQADPIYGPEISEVFHRKRQTISLKLIKKIHALINLRYMHVDRLLKSTDIGNLDIFPMEIEEYETVEEVARVTRAAWRLPSGPIQNVLGTIENAGGIVIPCDFETKKIDAISRWIPGLPPLFFINNSAPMDRLRFTLSHELGHIIMHRIPNSDMEKQADAFAAEFLMPAKEIKASLDNLSLERLAALKQYWKVSMASILYRARSLNKITENQARYLWAQMGRLGYKTREPAWMDPPKEQPMLLNELVKFHLSDLKYTIPQLSKMLALTETETRYLYLNQSRHLKVLK